MIRRSTTGDDNLMILIADLPGLEAARRAIQDRIDEIHRRISREHVRPSSPAQQDTPLEDPTIIGRDSLGRVIRKRRLSPEVIEKKRELMNRVREERVRKFRELMDRRRTEEFGAGTTSPEKQPKNSVKS